MNTISRAMPGQFYAVGIGPGSPDLLTVRAVRLVESAAVILAPQAKGSNGSLALQAIAPYLAEQQVVKSEYPMRRNGSDTRQHWAQIASEVLAHCRAGRSVVMVTLGDPLLFATTSYLLQELAEHQPADKLHVVPGVSAFQAGAARFGLPLTLQEDRLMLMSATDLKAVATALDQCETLVLYKAGPVLDELLDLLRERQLLGRTRLFSATEQGEGELLVADLRGWETRPMPYMTSMIIQAGHRAWDETEEPGTC